MITTTSSVGWKLKWDWMITSTWTIGDDTTFMKYLFYREFRSEFNDWEWIGVTYDRIIGRLIFRVLSKIKYKIHWITCLKKGHQRVKVYNYRNVTDYNCEYCDTWWVVRHNVST